MSRLAQAVSFENFELSPLHGSALMTHRLCSTSRLHRLLGNRIIGTPEDLGMPALKHIYEIQADRIRSEPLDKADTPFMKVRIASSYITRQMGRRTGWLTSYGLVVVVIVGMAIIGAIYGAKAGVAHVEAKHAQAKAQTEACASLRAVHMSPLPAYCN